MGDLTTHFSTAEFRCHGFGRPGHPDHPTYVHPPLLVVLEAIRSAAGRPVRIVSGHRCPWWNARVGGARASRHMRYDAADIEPGIITAEEAFRLGATGVGTKGPWAVHVDVRPGRRARWRY